MHSFDAWDEATLAIWIHMAAAILGLCVGAVVLGARKGGRAHRWLGRIFAAATLATALSSFLIHEINMWGRWSFIHLISLYVVGAVGAAIWAIRRGRVRAHQNVMLSLYLSGFIVAGGFTFMPERLLYDALLHPALLRVLPAGYDIGLWVGWAVPLCACALAGALWLRLRPRATDAHRYGRAPAE